MRRRRSNVAAGVLVLCALAAAFGLFGHKNTETINEVKSSDSSSEMREEQTAATDINSQETEKNSPARQETMQNEGAAEQAPKTAELYQVVSVVDGDTIKVNYQGKITSVRLIGVNTPETVDPRKSVECFGQEASNYLKSKLNGQTVTLIADPTQSDRDKYDRLLRYVYLDGKDVGLDIISNGYGYEYTYNLPYEKQGSYLAAQTSAENAGKGLWASGVCDAANVNVDSQSHQTSPAPVPSVNNGANCQIKGNINSKGEKIYHLPGQRFYNKTQIDTSKGERWFCSEQEAVNAGWRAAKV